ncbi:MAG TPA: cation diffusion facilitator family transporter [Ignavibacteriaceae bacterium]
MSHHSHSHSNSQTQDFSRAFIIGIVLNIIYIVVEVIYGLAINSMALIADAGHNFSDVLGLMLAGGAAYLAKSAATEKRTYGLRKSTILAAFFNAILLMIAVGAITIEAVRKLIYPEPVHGETMMIVASIGFVINGITALLFMKGREKDLNIKGAFIHMAADAGVSLGVVIAGFIIFSTGWLWVDPAVSIVIVIVITIGTWGLLRDSFHLSMDAVPKEINLNEVGRYLQAISGVEEVHDLHIWAMSTTETALTAHLVIPNETKDDYFLKKICGELHSKFGIEHSTIQIEKSAQSSNCEHRNV